MAIDLSTLSNSMVTAQALNNLILVWPQEQTGFQPQYDPFSNKEGSAEKFLFHYEGEQSITLDSDITDNYVEENFAIQDHIALAPEIIQTTGFIGELTDASPEALMALKQAADKLTAVSAYEPVLSVSAQKAYNLAFQAYQAFDILKRTKIPSFSGVGGTTSGPTVINTSQSAEQFASSVDFTTQNKQQIAFQKFYGYRKARALFTVQTPWAIFQNCAIQSLVATQAEDTRYITSFAITFKPINVAYTTTVGTQNDQQGRAYFQGAIIQDTGTSAVNYEELDVAQILSRTA